MERVRIEEEVHLGDRGLLDLDALIIMILICSDCVFPLSVSLSLL